MNASLKSKVPLATDTQGLRALITGHRRAHRHPRKPIRRHARAANVAAVVQGEDTLSQRTGGACRPGCLEEARATTAWLVRLNDPLSTWMTR